MTIWFETRRERLTGWVVALVASLVQVGLAGVLAVTVFTAGPVRYVVGGFEVPYGIELVVDGLSASMVVLIGYGWQALSSGAVLERGVRWFLTGSAAAFGAALFLPRMFYVESRTVVSAPKVFLDGVPYLHTVLHRPI